ncbi:Leucine aminopeptidase 1 [Cladobotryum mycophilum]|uniref:Peptide hydrolase n=1 Tax=Cladobotryum mycophilum TaxID=491253 RepID=A0ABR0S731_9HYPO
MKFSHVSLLAACAPAISARFIEHHEQDNVVLSGPSDEKFLVETAPGKTQWVTEEGKWELRRNGQNFIDITNHRDLTAERSPSVPKPPLVTYPKKLTRQDKVHGLFSYLRKENMEENLGHLTSYWTRYYNSDYGLQSSQWILDKVNSIIKEAGANETVTAKHFDHRWKQKSVIATIPGQSKSTIVIGAHQDSTNLWLPTILAAPGADDDGSGTVTIMEVFRTLLTDRDIIDGGAQNTIEFHWYSAEEAGLLGSQDIFSSYAKQKRDVKAMLQQDMTGYIQGTLDAGEPESVGVITDYVHQGLTGFIKKIIEGYCDIPWVETKCGYACSDHASASKAGYASAFVIESAFETASKKIHTTDDLMKYLSFDHMLQHAKMTLGLVVELGYHSFVKNEREQL